MPVTWLPERRKKELTRIFNSGLKKRWARAAKLPLRIIPAWNWELSSKHRAIALCWISSESPTLISPAVLEVFIWMEFSQKSTGIGVPRETTRWPARVAGFVYTSRNFLQSASAEAKLALQAVGSVYFTVWFHLFSKWWTVLIVQIVTLVGKELAWEPKQSQEIAQLIQ